MRRYFIVFMVFLSVFFAAGCADTDNGEFEITDDGIQEIEPQPIIDEGEVVDVIIEDFDYEPDIVTISSGDTVRWTNMDNVAHTATGGMFDSGILQPGESFEFLFTDPGTYNYYCSIHPDMVGTVIVGEETAIVEDETVIVEDETVIVGEE